MSAETEYIRGKYEERAGALVRRPAARFDERGNDVWAERSGRSYIGGFGAPDISPVSGSGMGNISRLVGGKRGKKGGARGSTGTTRVQTKAGEATKVNPNNMTQAQMEAHNTAPKNTKEFKSVEQMRRESNMQRKMEAINNPTTWQGKVLKGLARAGDFAAQGIGYAVPIPGLTTALQHLQQYTPGSQHYNPWLGESAEARKQAAASAAKNIGQAALENISGIDMARGAVNAFNTGRRALGMGYGGASPDMAALNLMAQGQARYEGDSDMMGGCYDCGGMEGGARMKKRPLTKMEKEALQIADGAASMNMSLDAHLKHHKVPAAKRRTILKRVANAHAKGH